MPDNNINAFDFAEDPCHILVTSDTARTNLLVLGIYTLVGLRGITETESEVTLRLVDHGDAWVHAPHQFCVFVQFDASRVGAAAEKPRVVRISVTRDVFQFVQSKVKREANAPPPPPLSPHHGRRSFGWRRAGANRAIAPAYEVRFGRDGILEDDLDDLDDDDETSFV